MPDKLKRALVFVHYDRHDRVDDYVLYYLDSARACFEYIVFVSTSVLSGTEIEKVQKRVDKLICRENVGYDFYSYKVGLEEVSRNGLDSYFEVVLCNDSVYGPLYPLAEMLAAMKDLDVDFWGVTDSTDIHHHLQSYFLAFRKKALLSPAFKNFWNDLRIETEKWEIIRKYEVGLTSTLESAGLKNAAFVKLDELFVQTHKRLFLLRLRKMFRMPVRDVLKKLSKILANIQAASAVNPTHLLWRELITKKRMPFIKIGLLRDNPMGLSIEDYERVIRDNTSYDVSLIRKHLARIK